MAKKDSKASLLWMDLEMTGLSPEKDKILEVAAIATDWELNEIDTFTAIVKCDEELMRTRMVGDFWENNKEARAGLMAQNEKGQSAQSVERELIAFVQKNFDDVVYLAGNSIHQDRRFIEREWPELDQKLHYRMLDVSAWKIYFENALHRSFAKSENHRALDDIRGSIEELKWYRKMIS